MTDREAIAAELAKPLNKAHVRPQQQYGPKGDYLEGWHVIAEANRIFGWDGWSYSIVDRSLVSERERAIGRDKKPGWGVSYLCRVRVVVGSVTREDEGTGHGYDLDLGLAHESAAKEAVTDALKRTLRTFGNPFGLALYDKSRENVAVYPVEKPTPQEQHPIRDAWEQGIWDSLPQDATEKDFWRNAHKQLRKEFSEYKSLRGLQGAFEKYGSILNRFEKFDAEAFNSLCRFFQECQEALANAPKPQILTKAAGEAILAGIAARDTLAELETYMHALRNGPNAFAADHPKIKAGYEEHRAAILEANPAEAKKPGPLDFFAQG